MTSARSCKPIRDEEQNGASANWARHKSVRQADNRVLWLLAQRRQRQKTILRERTALLLVVDDDVVYIVALLVLALER